MKTYPKIKIICPLKEKHLLITFSNNIKKIYDCNPLIKEDFFKPIGNEKFFKEVKIDQGGYGISWNESIDLSESELWINGKTVEQLNPGDA